jgi:hypothetical protein
VTSLSAMESMSFSDTFSAFGGGEFGKGDGIYIHGVWISMISGG